VGACLWRIVISPVKWHATLLHSSLYVIGFKRALNFGEAQVGKSYEKSRHRQHWLEVGGWSSNVRHARRGNLTVQNNPAP
jgi:hypothetical protein